MNNVMYEDQPQHNGVITNHSDTITADKMREIAGKNIGLELSIEIDWWLTRIEIAAKANKFSADRSEKMSSTCKSVLESRGFRVVESSTIEEKFKDIWVSTTVYW